MSAAVANWWNPRKASSLLCQQRSRYLVTAMVFPVVMYGCWELDQKEGWEPKNWRFWTVVFKTLESPLDSKGTQPVHPKGDQSWIFIGKTDVEAEIPILWPPDAKSWLIGREPDAGKDSRWEKGMTEEETVGWHHQLNGHEFEQAPGDSGRQWNLACCSPWGCKKSDINWVTELNWTEGGGILKSLTYRQLVRSCGNCHKGGGERTVLWAWAFHLWDLELSPGRTEFNCRTFSGCWSIAWRCVEIPTPYPLADAHTLIGWRTFLIPETFNSP